MRFSPLTIGGVWNSGCALKNLFYDNEALTSEQQSGAAEACWAYNSEVDGSIPETLFLCHGHKNLLFYNRKHNCIFFSNCFWFCLFQTGFCLVTPAYTVLVNIAQTVHTLRNLHVPVSQGPAFRSCAPSPENITFTLWKHQQEFSFIYHNYLRYYCYIIPFIEKCFHTFWSCISPPSVPSRSSQLPYVMWFLTGTHVLFFL